MKIRLELIEDEEDFKTSEHAANIIYEFNNSESTLDEVVEHFKRFLLAISFSSSLVERVQVVDDNEDDL